MELLRRTLERLHNLHARDCVLYRGATLPPRHMRFCGPQFRDDEVFLSSAVREAQRLVVRCGLSRESRLLDIGCGPGRLAIGVLRTLGQIGEYHGIDVNREAVEWCERHLAARNPRLRFTHVDVANVRYNPGGGGLDGGFRLPAADGSIDVVNLYSVFSHMTSGDVEVYLRDFRRVLAEDGRIFLTAFVEEGVGEEEVNPAGYRREWSGALHCVRYEKGRFERMLQAAGMRIVGFEYGRETDGQSAYYLGKVG